MCSHTQRPFSIRIFLPDGSSDGMRIIEKSNWTGTGVIVPRALYKQSRQREELSRTGIYVLVGRDEESDALTIYIGQGDPIRDRLDLHLANKDFWSWTVFFVTRDDSLNKAHISYLESKLIRLAFETKRAKLDNLNTPKIAGLTEADQADMDDFLEDILAVLPLVGLDAFEKPPSPAIDRVFFFLNSKGIHAQGYESPQGFVVQNGSTVVVEETPSVQAFVRTIRERLQEEGVLSREGEYYKLTQDYVFSSSSTAASVVLGRSASGPREWRDDKDRQLSFVNQEESAGS